MKIAFISDNYYPIFETKDFAPIVLELNELGFSATLITIKKEELNNYQAPFPLIQVSNLNEIVNAAKEFDVIVTYSLFGWRFADFIKEIKKLNKILIIKSDSDGRVRGAREPKTLEGFYHLKSLKLDKIGLKYFIKAFIPSVQTYIYKKILQEMEAANAITIESPDAANNLSFFLAKNNRPDLITKIKVIPNPVTPDIINSEINFKENAVVAIGRWNSALQKNPQKLIQSLNKFLIFKKDWKAIIIGSGENIIKKYVKNLDNSVKDRIIITGPIKHDDIKNHLLKSKIFFMPSRWESFGVAAAEALCCGCTIVGSPIESLRYLTMQGFSGSTSYSWDEDAFWGSLVYESNKWEKGEIDYRKTADFWRKKLNRQSIAKEFINVIQEIEKNNKNK